MTHCAPKRRLNHNENVTRNILALSDKLYCHAASLLPSSYAKMAHSVQILSIKPKSARKTMVNSAFFATFAPKFKIIIYG